MGISTKNPIFMDTDFSQISACSNNHRFTEANNAQGLSGAGTVFHYHVQENAI